MLSVDAPAITRSSRWSRVLERLPRSGRFVCVWHPESPGMHVVVYRPWWKRKGKEFATLRELGQFHNSIDALRSFNDHDVLNLWGAR